MYQTKESRREPLIDSPGQLPEGTQLKYRAGSGAESYELLVAIAPAQIYPEGHSAQVKVLGIGRKPAGSNLKAGDIIIAANDELFQF